MFSPSTPGKISFLGDIKFCNGSYTEALKLYDRAIELSPNNATYLSSRAAALSRLGRVGEALYHWEEALRLDPKQAKPKARDHVAPFLFRLGHVDAAMKHSVYNPSYYKVVREHLNNALMQEEAVNGLVF
ncbi:unnamed protein product [Microthlaspi erraticum]|uniref:Uncharacterized protein n=1 Tax=Microthlaspi erraticum TaxID=1685480 RepID=A0A6D2HCF0_9BRAS|nr:unnamed protein product [Microthlaspi erraticum]